MITNWKVSNFKSIRNETELNLGPLTIFAGANSSGKSTFIQSVLLVAQTLAHKVSSRSVVLNGAFTSLGQFDDLKSIDGEVDQISIKCTCHPLNKNQRRNPKSLRGGFYFHSRSNQINEITFEMAFDADPSNSQRDLFQIRPRLFATQLSCGYLDEDNVDQQAKISIHHSHKAISEIEDTYGIDEIDDQILDSLTNAVELDDGSMMEYKKRFRSAKPIGCKLRHFLPQQILYVIDTNEEIAEAIIQGLRGGFFYSKKNTKDIILSDMIIEILQDVLKDNIDIDQVFDKLFQQESRQDTESKAISLSEWNKCLDSLPLDQHRDILQVLFDQKDLFERILEALKNSEEKNHKNHDLILGRLPHKISEATWYLDNFFASSLKYLGPLRVAPKPLYPLAPAVDPHDVGLRGEHTASILELHKNNKIRYIPSANFKDPVVKQNMITRTLEAAVIDWLRYLGVASSVKSQDQGKLGHELKVGLANSDSLHDLTHVGVGVSQVLPILVMCLLADSDSTLVFEQPELHLHPKVQTLLGDFFLSMALSHKQCIVETHSEYFIDRLRFRIAAAPPEKGLNSQTKIYFVEKQEQGSSFREVEINEYGAISEWPEGFFDQSQQQAEEILRAAAKKRKFNRRKYDAKPT